MELTTNHSLQSGKYRIVEKIGRGGFGITYRALWQATVSGPMGEMQTAIPVAVKEFFFEDYCTRDATTSAVIITSATGREMFDRFKNKLKKEAQLLSKLRHPNIVRVLDVFEENNTAYIVMAFVEGESLRDKLRREGKLDERTALRYARQLCDALSEIHGNKILHLDIKPGNILIDKNDNVQLIDFGISKQYDDSHQETSTTPVGISKGFAPLEQYSGVREFLPAADVYAVGATLYNMLTGKIPPEAILLLNEPLKPVSDYVSGIDARIEHAIAKAMSSRYTDRQQSVEELKRDLFSSDAVTDLSGEGLSGNANDETVVDDMRGGRTVNDDIDRTAPSAASGGRRIPVVPVSEKKATVSAREEIPTPVSTNGKKNIGTSPVSEKHNRNKYITFGVFGVLLAVILFIVFKPNETAVPVIGTLGIVVDSTAVGDVTVPTAPQTKQSEKNTIEDQRRREAEDAERKRLAEAEAEKKRQAAIANAEPEMVYVQGGAFQMGSESGFDNEKPVHQVTVSSFYIGKYEVTQAQWRSVMGTNPSHFKGDNLPVESVSWTEAREFASRLSTATGKRYRLPTEAEWEYAARGGNKSQGYTYSGSNTLGNVAWCTDNSGSTTHSVGTKSPNELGIYD
ncbi:bifunctional serine/threonine-protein kinase/formylglycine-generating enzyme family protein, partial [Bacteroides sp. UBA939]|uniref:bifunctional serine/threonine-protein kinase/formylglycine-generating enzyme family protein n=1 Tax=Bacteroides sp. UBA939 TaxID=1946092 RepID=UPI0025B99DBE